MNKISCKICGSSKVKKYQHTLKCKSCGCLLYYPYPVITATNSEMNRTAKSEYAMSWYSRSAIRNHHNFTNMFEFAVENMTSHYFQKIKILDFGGGGGQFAMIVKSFLPNAEVFALDVSEQALATVKTNAEKNQVQLAFIHQSILETLDLGQQFDIIVSNPPYVRELEKQEIKKNVLDNEPHLALFVEDNDALIFYRKIAQLAQKNLNPQGQLYFEINQYLGQEMLDLLQGMGFKNSVLRQDIYGNDRMIQCTI